MKWVEAKPVRLLAYDIENEPGTYGPGDFTHPKVTALGAQFLDEDVCRAWIFNRRNIVTMRRQCEDFRHVWDQADAVVGHNIRRHDKKILDGLYVALDLPILPARRAIDTYLDQPKLRGLSRSLENLAARWKCPEQKIHLSEHDWEAAYDGIPWGLEKMKQRVKSDVRISIWLFHELKRRKLL